MLTKEKLQSLRMRIEDFNQTLEKELGLRLDLGNISYNAESARGKLQIFSTVGHASAKDAKRIADFKAGMHKFGLTLTDLDREFSWRGQQYRLVTLRPRAPKYPFVVEVVGTTRVVCLPRI